MAMKKRDNTLSVDEELMVSCAYRYAIGRHTYVCTLADHIAKNYYDRISDERLEFMAEDIRRAIGDCFSFGGCSLYYDGSVPYDERNAFEDLMLFFKENIYNEDDINKYERIEIYKESYTGPKKIRTYTCTPQIKRYNSEMDIDDLLIWYSLASFFDKKNYVKVTASSDSGTEDIICFKSWHKCTEPTEDGKYYKFVPYRWEECYIDVSRFKEKGRYAGYIAPEYIKKITPLEKTED